MARQDCCQIVNAAGEDERLRVASISRGLTRLAKDEQVPLVVLSELARADRDGLFLYGQRLPTEKPGSAVHRVQGCLGWVRRRSNRTSTSRQSLPIGSWRKRHRDELENRDYLRCSHARHFGDGSIVDAREESLTHGLPSTRRTISTL